MGKRLGRCGRLRRFGPVAAVLALAVACGPTDEPDAAAGPTTGAVTTSTATKPASPEATSHPPATPAASPAPTSPSASTPAQTTPPPWPRVTFARLSFEMPPDWTLTRYGATEACVQPARRAGLPTMFGCAGIAVRSGSIAGNERRPYAAHQPGGWYAATDVQPCPLSPALPDGSFNGIVSGTSAPPVASGLRAVGPRTAAYDRWSAACASGYRFSPQAWHLPVSRVLFLDYTGHAETARVLASVRFPD